MKKVIFFLFGLLLCTGCGNSSTQSNAIAVDVSHEHVLQLAQNHQRDYPADFYQENSSKVRLYADNIRFLPCVHSVTEAKTLAIPDLQRVQGEKSALSISAVQENDHYIQVEYRDAILRSLADRFLKCSYVQLTQSFLDGQPGSTFNDRPITLDKVKQFAEYAINHTGDHYDDVLGEQTSETAEAITIKIYTSSVMSTEHELDVSNTCPVDKVYQITITVNKQSGAMLYTKSVFKHYAQGNCTGVNLNRVD